MGTSGAYSGSGGKAGRDISSGAGDWLDSLPASGGDGPTDGTGPIGGDGATGGDGQPGDGANIGDAKPPVELPPKLVAGALSMLRPRTGSGSGGGGVGMGGGGGRVRGGSGGSGSGGGGGGGGRRSTARVSSSTGRAAAAAYAYATGDREGLQALGLDYDNLLALNDPLAVACRIVDVACDLPNSTIEDGEERWVAADVAEWVLQQAEAGAPPTPEEITRHAIGTIIAEVISTEMGEVLRQRAQNSYDIELELRESAQILADKADLSVTGASAAELASAIEGGIEALRAIYGAES
jgi:hypothetical protein